MKTLIACGFILLAPVLAVAGPADMNLYISYWPDGAEEPTDSLNLEYEEGVLAQLVYDKDGNETITEAAVENGTQSADVALMQAAIRSVIARISLEQEADITGASVVVEWSVSTNATFARGNSVIPFDAQPAEILAVQDKVFGTRLAP